MTDLSGATAFFTPEVELNKAACDVFERPAERGPWLPALTWLAAGVVAISAFTVQASAQVSAPVAIHARALSGHESRAAAGPIDDAPSDLDGFARLLLKLPPDERLDDYI